MSLPQGNQTYWSHIGKPSLVSFNKGYVDIVLQHMISKGLINLYHCEKRNLLLKQFSVLTLGSAPSSSNGPMISQIFFSRLGSNWVEYYAYSLKREGSYSLSFW